MAFVTPSLTGLDISPDADHTGRYKLYERDSSAVLLWPYGQRCCICVDTRSLPYGLSLGWFMTRFASLSAANSCRSPIVLSVCNFHHPRPRSNGHCEGPSIMQRRADEPQHFVKPSSVKLTRGGKPRRPTSPSRWHDPPASRNRTPVVVVPPKPHPEPNPPTRHTLMAQAR